jgi:hypothetical protein
MGIYTGGQGMFYDDGVGIPDPWVTAGDAWQAGWTPSCRIYISEAGAAPTAPQIIIIQSNKESEETPFYINGSWTNENGYLYTCLPD